MNVKKFNFYLFVFFSIFALSFTSCNEDDTIEVIGMPDISLEQVESTEESSITIKFVPNSHTSYYEYAIGKESDRESFAEGKFSSIEKQQGNEEKSITFEKLDPEASYTVFARSYTSEDEGSAIASLKVRTNPTDFFDAELQYVSDVSLGFTMWASPNYYKFEYAVATANDKEAFEKGTLSGIRTKSEFDQYTANYYDLSPNTDYVIYTRAYSRDNEITATKEITFTTFAEDECPGVDFVLHSINPIKADYELIPNSKCSKIAIRVVEDGKDFNFLATIESFGQFKGDILATMTAWVGTNPWTGNLVIAENSSLPIEHTFQELKAGIPFEIYALLYGDNKNTPFCVKKIDFKIPYDPNAPEAIVEVEISDITENGATYTYTPNEHTLFYLYDTVEADTFDEEWAKHGNSEEWLLEYLMDDYNSWFPSVKINWSNSSVIFTETQAEPGTRYYGMAYPLNMNGLLGRGKITMEEYTTLP